MEQQWMTTTEAARELGVSRQHVVNLCDRGELAHRMVGRHRRIAASEIRRVSASSATLTPESEKSLWLHRAVLGHLVRDPDAVIELARANLDRWENQHRRDGMTHRYLAQWRRLLEGDLDVLADALVSRDPTCIELRQNSPFAGVLPDDERRQVLRAHRARRESSFRAA